MRGRDNDRHRDGTVDETQSKLPVFKYPVPYAIGAVLLAAGGPVIVLLTH